jgi:C4-dicarboxylate-specific signal transduction histidine kinase
MSPTRRRRSGIAQPESGGAAAALARLQQELVATHRLALLGTAAGMIAHEFSNLMQPTLAYAHEALRTRDEALMLKALERTVRQTERSIAISRRLLELAHAAPTKPESCPVRQAVEDALLSMTRPPERDGIEVAVDVDAELRVRAERLMLEQLLLNLLLNSREAVRSRHGHIDIRARRHGKHVIIDVRDDGRGIPALDIEQRINPFLATDCRADPSDWRSVGLGLNVCRLIAQSHGASLQVLPGDGPGCTFRLRWPAA